VVKAQSFVRTINTMCTGLYNWTNVTPFRLYEPSNNLLFIPLSRSLLISTSWTVWLG